MAQHNTSSIAGGAIRLTRLGPDQAPLVGVDNSYVTRAFVSVSMTPEYEDGDEFIQKSAGGEVCVNFKAADTLKRVSLEIAICNPDPEFTEMAAGGELLTDSNEMNIGWAAPLTGVDATPNGVAVEVWSRAVKDGKPFGPYPFYHWLFPFAILRQGGDRVIENDILATSFEGYSLGNDQFSENLTTAPRWPFITDRAYAYALTTSIPTGSGYQAVTAGTGV